MNGRVVEPDEPAVAAGDHALVGDGAFEAIKVLEGKPFALTRHLNRLVTSAEPLGIRVDLDVLHRAISEILTTSPAQHSPCWLRVTVTAGVTPMATGARSDEPTVVASVAPMAGWGPTTDAVIVPWTRNERGATAGLKTISYAENVIALRYAHDRGAEEGIFANTAGDLCEGAGSNIFVVLDDDLVTPPLSSGCLAGVTRELLCEWLPEVIERDIPLGRLDDVEEAFLTSTSRDVHPVRSLEGRPLVAPGIVTQRAAAAFAEGVSRSADP